MLISRLRCRERVMDARREAQQMAAPFASYATPQTRALSATQTTPVADAKSA